VDAVLLAWFAGSPRRAKTAADLGSGVGAVGLCLLFRDRVDYMVLAELDPDLSRLSKANLKANGWSTRGEAVEIDVRTPDMIGTAAYDLVVCNPPYVEEGRGRPRAVAKGARIGKLAIFTDAARLLLRARGRACFVYPALELATLLETLRASGLEPKRLCLVHASDEQPARVALVEAQPAKRGGLVVLPPFIERDAAGPTSRLRRLLGGRAEL